MLNRLLRAALLFCVPGAALAEPSVRPGAVEPTSMRFEWVREGPADVCGQHCREWITATGPITAETAQDFEFFTQVRDPHGATLVLDSGGGSVLASLELGRKVRKFSMITTVGHVAPLAAAAGEERRGRLSPRGECASMCVFVLLGGVKRQVPAEARILVHQIWPGGKRYDAGAETYTADEIARIQRDVGRIARYTVEMGGDIELFELAMRIPPWERLRALSQIELRRMGLQNLDVVAEVPTSGAVAPGRPNNKASPTRAPERGWTLTESARPAALQRRHALTLEGEEIGQFELTLACAEAGKSYKIAYAETRFMADDAAPAGVNAVTLLLGNDRVALTVESSARGGAAELASVASGTVTTDFIEQLRKDPASVIIVGTRTEDNLRTSIRVGSTGFGKAFSRLATDCAK